MKTEVKRHRSGGWWTYWVRVGRVSNYGTRATEGAARDAAYEDGRVLTLVNQLRTREEDE